MRRTKEFDKPDMISDIFYGLVPEHHTVQPTNDAWRYQRKLMQDLMAPAFLNGVAAPQLHSNFQELVKLWSEKLRLGKGRPFNVKHDIYDTALEAIWAAVFGIEDTATVTRSQIDLLAAKQSVNSPSSTDEAVEFPRAEAPPVFRAILSLTDGLEYIVKSPFPRLVGFVQRYLPATRRHVNVKNRVITEEIAKAERRLEKNKGSSENVTNAVDHMLRREKIAAEKLGRPPQYQSKVMAAEVRSLRPCTPSQTNIQLQLFGLCVAGHDTVSTTVLWTLKFLASAQHVQTKLRAELHSVFAAARAENRVPSAHEICTVHSDYLDACIEELLRCAQTANIITRTSTQDAVVLGHLIPKGTRIAMCGNGGGVLKPTFNISDSNRSGQYRKADGGKTGTWEPSTMTQFDPERWLVPDATGKKVFDASAGPTIVFGAGPRGCFGRKLAYLELRLAIVLVVWTFVLNEVPEAYAGWEAMDGLTHAPVLCYVKLSEA
jgi:cytochrome P450